jgi:hypothetical protein
MIYDVALKYRSGTRPKVRPQTGLDELSSSVSPKQFETSLNNSEVPRLALVPR